MKKKLSQNVAKNDFFGKNILFLGLMIAVYILTFSFLAIQRHNAFASNFDLANMDQTLWNTINGRFFSLSTAQGTLSRLSIHADFILILLAPLYLIWNDVRMLLIAQTIFIAFGAVPIYLLTTKLLGSSMWALVISALYLLYPSLQWVNIYDFHPVSLAIPFLLFAFYYSYQKKWREYFLFVLLAIITKEQVSLIIAMWGVLQIILFKEKKLGLISLFLGLAWFPIMVFLVIPNFGPSGQHWAFDVWFKDPKDQVSQNPLLGVGNLISSFFSFEAINYYLGLLKPLLFLPLLGLPFLLVSLPDLGINVISSFPEMRSNILHYDSALIPGLFLGTIFGLQYAVRFFLKYFPNEYRWLRKKQKLLALLVLTPVFFLSIVKGPLPLNPFCWCGIYYVGENEKKFAQLLSTIPPEASIAASREIRAHLTHREHAFDINEMAFETEYLALIDQQRYIGNFYPREYEIELKNRLKFDPRYELIFDRGHYSLFRRINSQY